MTRFEVGSLGKLTELDRRLPSLFTEFRIFIVQPGLSEEEVSSAQLELLGVTDLYLKETYATELGVLASS